MRTLLYPQVKWQATLRTVGGSQTLVVSRLSKPECRRASEGDLVLLGNNSDRWDLVKDQVGGGITWWPDRKRAIRASSFLLLICFASRETLRCLYTEATRSCIGGASRIVSLMT